MNNLETFMEDAGGGTQFCEGCGLRYTECVCDFIEDDFIITDEEAFHTLSNGNKIETITEVNLCKQPKIISIEGKCGVGKSTWLKERGVITPETVDFKVDERTHNRELEMIPIEDQLDFVRHKIEQFKEKLEELRTGEDDIYIDGSMLYNIAYGAGYYHWYLTYKEDGSVDEAYIFIDGYLKTCDDLLKNLPEGWQDKLQSLILLPQNEEDLRERILKRGRPSEAANIDSMLEVNSFFYYYLIKILDKYNIKYTYQVIKNK